MVWGEGTSAAAKKKLKPDDYFKPVDEFQIRALTILLFGEASTLKTGFAMSCPPPVYGVDTEGKWPNVKRHYPGKEIYVFDLLEAALDPNTDEMDPKVALDEIENALSALATVNEGTIAIDSLTDIDYWLSAWLEKTAMYRSEKTGKPYQFEWGRRNTRFRQLIQRLLAKKDVTKVLTCHPKEIYVAKEASGKFTARAHETTPFLADVVLHTYKLGVGPQTSYQAVLEKCSFAKAYNTTIVDPSYEKLIDVLERDLKIKVGFKRNE